MRQPARNITAIAMNIVHEFYKAAGCVGLTERPQGRAPPSPPFVGTPGDPAFPWSTSGERAAARPPAGAPADEHQKGGCEYLSHPSSLPRRSTACSSSASRWPPAFLIFSASRTPPSSRSPLPSAAAAAPRGLRDGPACRRRLAKAHARLWAGMAQVRPGSRGPAHHPAGAQATRPLQCPRMDGQPGLRLHPPGLPAQLRLPHQAG